LSDIIKFRQLIENGYSILQINVDDLGQTVIEFSFADKCHPKGSSILLQHKIKQ